MIDTGSASSAVLKKLIVPVTDTKNVIGKGFDFEVTPAICHFSGFLVGKQYVQEISIININTSIKRLEILPLKSSVYKLQYDLIGTLAPGLCQKFKIIFAPEEYKYYYECIRVHTKEQDLLIPIHGYPVLNKISFPREISFGFSPLCEPVSKVNCNLQSSYRL